MQVSLSAYNERYNLLNEAQQEAVNTIFGPVMVIAGPGTGKTEVLSMRIANLLLSEAQVLPQDILCLTYTDEATNAMRKRLLQIIGTAAHKVNIHTFHGFCNSVIQQNSDYFSNNTLQPVTDLERIDILHNLINDLPKGHVLRRLSGNIYYDAYKLKTLFDLMKREHLSAKTINESIDTYLAQLPERPDYVYQKATKNNKKGDVKQAKLDEETQRMETTRAAAFLFDKYNEMMLVAARYDFNDMITWVIDAFRKHPGLLQQYQERFQFLLVDEFQDTNGAQNEILQLLADYWEEPNLFVVGDDDQSIYEFQGARVKNIIDFYTKYQQSVKVIVLTHNYRSTQPILDMAMLSINNNKSRLVSMIEGIDKIIAASNPEYILANDLLPAPEVRVYENIAAEEADIVNCIEQLQASGVPLYNVALLYAQHKQADNIIHILEKKGIPYNVKKPVNVLDEPITKLVINILQYLDSEKQKPFSAEALLFEILHTPCLGIASTDIALLALYMQDKGLDKTLKYWRVVLGNGLWLHQLNLSTADAMIRLGKSIESWLQLQTMLSLPMLLEKIIYESGLVGYLLNGVNRIWDIQVLNTFFSFVKETAARQSDLTVHTLLEMIDRMRAENIALPLTKIIQNDNGVKFYSAHGAKGNEFEYVFLLGCTKNFWEDKRGASRIYKLPDTITLTNAEDTADDNNTEVARRLFFVALTRAKKHLFLSYAKANNDGKELSNSVFIDEVSQVNERELVKVPQEAIVQHIANSMTVVSNARIELANRAAIERILQQPTFALSYTNLSKFLRCPLQYYYESILKVPILPGPALGFGIAVHEALEYLFLEAKKKGSFPEKETLIQHFEKVLYSQSNSFTKEEYLRRKEHGTTILDNYYERVVLQPIVPMEVEYKVPKLYIDGVPVTGKIDRIDFDGDKCTVIDYKTGNPDNVGKNLSQPNEEEPNGGDYWRQMVFYKLMLEAQEGKAWMVQQGRFEYIEPSRKTGQQVTKVVPIFETDETTVKQQLKSVFGRIMNQDFDQGCGKEDCYWCNFTAQYKILQTKDEE